MADTFDREFHEIFGRVSAVIDFKGAYGVDAVNERIELSIHYLANKEELMKDRGQKPSKWLSNDQEQLEKLLKHDRFASRVTSELVYNPDGIVAQTIRYGRKEARKRLLKRARERHGRLRTVRKPKRRR